MKRSELRNIIREELDSLLSEGRLTDVIRKIENINPRKPKPKNYDDAQVWLAKRDGRVLSNAYTIQLSRYTEMETGIQKLRIPILI